MKKYYIQLFSVKTNLEEDFDGTLKALSEMGYDGVQFYGKYGGYTGEELREKLDYYGLSADTVHLSLNEIQNNFEYHKDILKAIGCKSIICPFTDPKTVSDAERIGNELLEAATKVLAYGFEFGYHNHAQEFKKDDNDNYFLDIMLEIGDPLVLAELDLGWVAYAGENAEAYIRKYAGRVTYLHFKQFREIDGELKTCTFENGIVDIEKCVKTAEIMGCEYYIVEQDNPIDDELAEAKQNLEFIKSIG